MVGRPSARHPSTESTPSLTHIRTRTCLTITPRTKSRFTAVWQDANVKDDNAHASLLISYALYTVLMPRGTDL